MTPRPLSTGSEPPKGFDMFYAARDAERARNQGSHVERVAATQLSTIEIRELESVRSQAIERIKDVLGEGDRPVDFTFQHEMNLWPQGKSPSDKLTYRAFLDGELLGYALVVRGWPDNESWTIQHLIIGPGNRLKGVGKGIVEAIEKDALETTDNTSFIVAVPVTDQNNSFWDYMGYEPVGQRDKIGISDYEFTFQRHRKAIR